MFENLFLIINEQWGIYSVPIIVLIILSIVTLINMHKFKHDAEQNRCNHHTN